MSQILEMLHLAEQNGVAEVQVRRSRVEAGFDAQGTAFFGAENNALPEILFADQLGEAFFQVKKLFVRSFGHQMVFYRAMENAYWEALQIFRPAKPGRQGPLTRAIPA